MVRAFDHQVAILLSDYLISSRDARADEVFHLVWCSGMEIFKSLGDVFRVCRVVVCWIIFVVVIGHMKRFSRVRITYSDDEFVEFPELLGSVESGNLDKTQILFVCEPLSLEIDHLAVGSVIRHLAKVKY